MIGYQLPISIFQYFRYIFKFKEWAVVYEKACQFFSDISGLVLGLVVLPFSCQAQHFMHFGSVKLPKEW